MYSSIIFILYNNVQSIIAIQFFNIYGIILYNTVIYIVTLTPCEYIYIKKNTKF